MNRSVHAHFVGAASAPGLGLRLGLRAHACIALFAVATLGCGGARSGSGSLFPADGSAREVRTLRCGTYTEVESGIVGREGELATVPYVEVVLGETDPCGTLPLVVVLHGLGDHPVVPRWPYRDLPVGVRIVLPRGPIRWGSGYAWSSVRVLDHEDTGLAATMSAQSDRIAAFIERLRGSVGVEGEVVLTGFSQGAILALTVLMRHPEHLGLVLPLAGWVPQALRTAAGEHAPPVRWMHGTADERVPFSMAVDAVTDLRTRGYDVELVAYEGAHHSMSDAMDERFHSWLAQVLTNIAASQPPETGLVLEP
jgi:phospholipase/carboxylesterase